MIGSQREEAPSAPPARAGRRMAERLKSRWFDEADHPYVHLEHAIARHLTADALLVEAGCGRDAELLRRFKGRARELVGLDPVDFSAQAQDPAVRLVQGHLGASGLPDASVDLMISRALMEHVEDPAGAFAEIARVLKPGGRYVFLAPNLGDYTTWVAMLVPNSFHARIVRATEGRPEHDTFPTFFRCNSRRAITKLCSASGLELERFEYLGQYPSYFLFNPLLFALASGYEKLISSVAALGFLRGWLLAVVRRPEGR